MARITARRVIGLVAALVGAGLALVLWSGQADAAEAPTPGPGATLAGVLDPVTEVATQVLPSTEPLVDEVVEPTVAAVAAPVDQVLTGVVEVAPPIFEGAADRAAPVTDRARSVVAPILDALPDPPPTGELAPALPVLPGLPGLLVPPTPATGPVAPATPPGDGGPAPVAVPPVAGAGAAPTPLAERADLGDGPVIGLGTTISALASLAAPAPGVGAGSLPGATPFDHPLAQALAALVPGGSTAAGARPGGGGPDLPPAVVGLLALFLGVLALLLRPDVAQRRRDLAQLVPTSPG